MTAENTENGISLNLTIEDAKILKHLMGSIVFMDIKDNIINCGYANELIDMKAIIIETYIKLSDKLGRG